MILMTTKTANATAKRPAKQRTQASPSKPKPKTATRAKRDAKESKSATKKVSQIEAAAIVLGQSKDALTCRQMVDAMTDAGLWSSPGGATPDATLYASILREIKTKGKEARFRKTERGRFALAAGR